VDRWKPENPGVNQQHQRLDRHHQIGDGRMRHLWLMAGWRYLSKEILSAGIVPTQKRRHLVIRHGIVTIFAIRVGGVARLRDSWMAKPMYHHTDIHLSLTLGDFFKCTRVAGLK